MPSAACLTCWLVSLTLLRHAFCQSNIIDLYLNNPQLDTNAGRAAQNIVYFGEYYVGTPGQRFLACFDTGSGDVWLPSISCTSDVCLSHDQYDPSASSTAVIPPVAEQTTVSLSYGTGQVVTTKLYDDLTIANITVPKQAFGAASTLSQDFATLSCDGLVGLAFPKTSNLAISPVLMAAADQGLIKNRIFGIFFDPLPDVEPAGSLSIGSIQPEKFTGTVSTLEVVSPKYWSVSLDSIELGERSFSPSVSEAILDSGTTAIYLPAADVKAINSAIPTATYWAKQDIWNVTCDYSQLPDLTFILAGKPFSLPPSLYVQMLKNTKGTPLGVCASVLLGGKDRVILGSNFLRAWYTQYTFSSDPNGPASVGLARAVGLTEQSTVSEVLGRKLKSDNKPTFNISMLHSRHYDSFDQPKWGWTHPSRRGHASEQQQDTASM